MSKGIGSLQQRIVDALAGAPGACLAWDELTRRFPREAKLRSLHRAARGLLARDLIFELHFGERRHLVLTVHGDEELRALVEASFSMLETVCRARGVPLPDLSDPSWETSVDAYRPGSNLSD